MNGLTDYEEVHVDTPFGKPSDSITIGSVSGQKIAFLPRHGKGHRISPTQIPVQANIYALKTLGIERIVSISAVGSLQEIFKPRDIVIPDQLIDRTKGRPSTFFEDGIVAHVGFANPFCTKLNDTIVKTAQRHNIPVHQGGTCVVIEGPQFSTRAESDLYRKWGASIIGMTALPEAKLAREAEICYSTIAMVTDYDCWDDAEDTVSVEIIVANLIENSKTAQRLIQELISNISIIRNCECVSALKDAIITQQQQIPNETLNRLSVIVNKYLDRDC